MIHVARISYLFTIAVCGTLGVYSAAQWLTSIFAAYGDFYTAAVITLFLFPCGKAIVRRVRGAPLLPRPQDSNTRAYLIAITVTGIFGHLFFAAVASAYVDIRLNHLSDVSGIGAAMIVAAALYLLTLWVGELVVATSGRAASESRNPFSGY